MPPTSSPVPRLPSCSVCCLHRPHHRQRSPLRHHRTSNQDEREGGHLVGVWAMSSPHLATTLPPPRHRSTATSSDRAAPRRSAILPAQPRSLPLFQGVRVGQRYSQGGRSSASHHVDPLHPAGEGGRIYPVKFWLSSENQGHTRAAVALFQARKSPQILFLSLSNH